MNCPASNFIKTGIKKGARRVEMVVSVTDKATLARAKKAITLEAVPPGAQPTNIIPAATSGSSPLSLANPNPTKGMIANCAETPIATDLGL